MSDSPWRSITQALLKAVDAQDISELPDFAWPGAYPIVYMDIEGLSLCPKCARENDEFTNTLTDYYIHYEGPPIECEHCYQGIDSAYGEEDNDD